MPMQKDENPYLGAALRKLRDRKEILMKDLSPKIGRTVQEISRWERAERPVPVAVVERYLLAVGATRAELDKEIQRLAALDDPANALPGEAVNMLYYAPSELRMLTYVSDDMASWVEPGEKVFYEPCKMPKRQEGCVVEYPDRGANVRIVERFDQGRVFLKTLNPPQIESYLWSDIKGLHRIFMRGD